MKVEIKARVILRVCVSCGRIKKYSAWINPPGELWHFMATNPKDYRLSLETCPSCVMQDTELKEAVYDEKD